MKLKLDENLSRHLKDILIALQYDVLTAADQGLLCKSDMEIAEWVRKEGRLLLSLDLEFGDLRKYPPGRHPGIIVFRPRSFGPLAVNRIVEEFIKETDLRLLSGCVVVVEPTRVRVRRPPLESDSDKWEEIPI
jgi:predicted nuclease of predicted toxin-antitoxin system